MTKPLGYYTSYTPGDRSTFAELEEMFGTNLETLTVREKLFLIGSLASQLCVKKPGEVRASVQVASIGISQELQPGDIEGLLDFLINQVRWGQNEPTLHNV
jgi:hypothetical protein